MIPFIVLFLFATSALGADYMSNYEENQHRSGSGDSRTIFPMDYFDDIFNRDLKIKPESMFSYNFEQTRRDQPPQVEMREENVGRYFHSRPTTTTPGSIFSMKAENEAQHVYPNMRPRNNFDRNDFSREDFTRDDISRNDNNRQSWNEPPKSTVPPPRKFAFSRPHNEAPREFQPTQYHNRPMKVAQPQNEHRHAVRLYQPHPSPIQTTVQPAMQWTEDYHFPSRNMFVPTPAPYVPQYAKASEISFSPSASYVSDSVNGNKQTFHHSMPRGHHKFNDLRTNYEEAAPIRNHHLNLPQAPLPTQTTLRTTTVQPTTVRAVSDSKAPPPVPTLSPWYDGFGK